MNIARLKEEYQKTGCPIISMDSKKKEDIGNFFRAGSLYTQKEICVYDIIRNTGYICQGTSRDTSEFACDSLR